MLDLLFVVEEVCPKHLSVVYLDNSFLFRVGYIIVVVPSLSLPLRHGHIVQKLVQFIPRQKVYPVVQSFDQIVPNVVVVVKVLVIVQNELTVKIVNDPYGAGCGVIEISKLDLAIDCVEIEEYVLEQVPGGLLRGAEGLP